jgi:hypothetical protein
MSDFSRGVGGSVKDASVDNEACADASAKREKDELLQVGPRLANAEMELGKRSGVAIVFDVDGNSGEGLFEVLL